MNKRILILFALAVTTVSDTRQAFYGNSNLRPILQAESERL